MVRRTDQLEKAGHYGLLSAHFFCACHALDVFDYSALAKFAFGKSGEVTVDFFIAIGNLGALMSYIGKSCELISLLVTTDLYKVVTLIVFSFCAKLNNTITWPALMQQSLLARQPQNY